MGAASSRCEPQLEQVEADYKATVGPNTKHLPYTFAIYKQEKGNARERAQVATTEEQCDDLLAKYETVTSQALTEEMNNAKPGERQTQQSEALRFLRGFLLALLAIGVLIGIGMLFRKKK